MSILYRYIAKSVIAATLLVVLVMIGLSLLINLLGELKDVGTGDYSFMQSIIHVIFELPHNLYQFFPMLVLLGGVLGLGVLASNQELVVMRTAGFSMYHIAKSVVIAALLLILLATSIGEYLGPKGHHLADIRKQTAENNGQAVSTLSGVWIHEGNNFLRIRSVTDLKHLEGVTRYQFNETHHLLAAYYVESLDLEKGKWLFHDMLKTTFLNNQTSSQHITEGIWDLALNPQLLNVGLIEADEMLLPKLYWYSHHLIENKLEATHFQWEFWKRFFQPLTTLVMVLLAIPFVFRSSRSVTTGWRALFAVSVGFVFYILNAFIGEFSVVFQFSPIFAAIFPTVLFASLGLVFALRYK